jgi:hypothetical protein
MIPVIWRFVALARGRVAFLEDSSDHGTGCDMRGCE